MKKIYESIPDIKNKIIITSGYMGSGSTAITNLISEIDGYNALNNDFEYVFLHCPNGLFDLEDKLLHGNNILRSDEAIHSFLVCMCDLFDKKHYWVGNYKEYVSEKFLEYVNEFIHDLVTEELNDEWAFWYYKENPTTKILLKRILRKIIYKISFGKIILPYPVTYKGQKFAYPNPEEFYNSAKIFLSKIYKDMGIEKNNLVLDQLLLPHNLFRIKNYFDENVLVFVVERDPRDVFLLNKYFWIKQQVAVSFPTDVIKFCKMYKAVKKIEKKFIDSRVYRIKFEDLIYQYDKTINKIYDVLEVCPDAHLYKKKIFNPDVSINNTQIFLLNEEYSKEANYITENLQEYIYEFPSKDFVNRNLENVF